MTFHFDSMTVAKEDRCTSVLEAQHNHPRGVNECTSRARRENPYNRAFFTYQSDHFLTESYARRRQGLR